MFKAAPACGGGGISLCEMTEGADVSEIADLSVTVVGADPCVRPLKYHQPILYSCRGVLSTTATLLGFAHFP